MDTPVSEPLCIGELSARTGVSVRAIRHYDASGLLASHRGANGYRGFSLQAVGQVRQIRHLIDSGFSVAEILRFPECMRASEGAKLCPDATAAYRARLLQVEQQLGTLAKRRARLLASLAEAGA